MNGIPLGDRIMKVVHAGEHGAVQIYRGQQLGARWSAPHLVAELAEFQRHEMRHRAIFEQELRRRGSPRCRSFLLCAVGGWTLGALTGLIGSRAIAATTIAVERVVLRHLADYRSALSGSDEPGFAALSAMLADEQAHHDSFATGFRPKTVDRAIDQLVAGMTEAVIWLGMKL